MKTTFQDAGQLVHDMAAGHHDETIPLNRMWFNSLDRMGIQGQDVELLPSAQRLFANKLRVPMTYLERCSYGLQAHNLNYWLEQEKMQRDTLFCRFDKGKLRAVFTDRYKALDNKDVIDKMSVYGIAPETEVHLNLDTSLMVVKVPDYSRAFDINTDKMVPGIAVSNSEVGVLAFSVEAYFYRLVCTNGLISKTQVASKFRHVSYKALEEFDLILEQVISESRHNQNSLEFSVERVVEDPAKTIASFNRQFQLTRKESEAVEGAWALEPGDTMFAVINAYTRAAQGEGMSSEETTRLERIGGRILALTQ
jgi:hypothetical protein